MRDHSTGTNNRDDNAEVAEGLGQESAMHRFVLACLVLTLIALGGWADGQTGPTDFQGIDSDTLAMIQSEPKPTDAIIQASASEIDFPVTPNSVQNNEVFNIVVIGDSIAWGAGLTKYEKYSYLVANWIAEQSGRPIDVKVLAHTGATLKKKTADQDNQYPDIPSSNPTLFEQVDDISNPDDVDLVLVSGGANDVDLGELNSLDYGWAINTFLGGSTLTEIQDDSWDKIETPMYELLKKLLDKCPNAKIIVTGYYSAISEDSKGLTEFYEAFEPISQAFSGYRNADDPTQLYELTTKSNAFYEKSNLALNSAVLRANRETEQSCVEFAEIVFPSDKSYGTDNSWLWKIEGGEGNYRTNDHKYDIRAQLSGNPEICNILTSAILADECKQKIREDRLAAVGHPNVEGAENYSESIIRVINNSWPDWLHPLVLDFSVSPPSLPTGESFRINYEVSSNCSEGLKHVELWRKYDQNDWQEIDRYTLSEAPDSFSSSFTDSPPASGNYRYGVHVVDNAGNWNDERNSNTNGQSSSFEPVEVEVVGSAPPIVEAFQVTPQSLNLGESFAIDYTVSDSSGSGLSHVELWRKNETSDWQEISTNTLAGETDSVSGSLTDSPSSPGKYWYGVHVVDNTVNWNDEKNSNSKNSTSHFVPIAVEVKENSLASVGSTTQDSEANVVGKWLIIQGTGELITVYDEYGNADSFQDTGLYYAEFYNDGNYSGTNRYVSLMGLQDSIISGQNGLGGETGKWVQTGNSIRVQRENDKAYEWIISGDTMSGFEIYSDGDKTPVFAERVSAEEFFPDGEWP